jgi:hypothetical protein
VPDTPTDAPTDARSDGWTGRALTTAALNRALLARQHLLARTAEPAVTLVDRLVGLQAQNPWSPYVGLWSRVAGFRHAELADALVDRRVARIVVMRGTIHLVTAPDAVLLPALVRPLLDHNLVVNAAHGANLRGVDVAQVTALARTLVEERPRGGTELGRLLAERFPQVPPGSLAHAARGTLPLVQVPPRGLWGRSGAPTLTTAWSWLGVPPVDLSDPDAWADAMGRVVLRYLAAFGPATVADVQAWSGLTGLRAVVDRLGDAVVELPGPAASPRGRPRVLLDVPGAPLPEPDVPAPVRFLPDYDNVFLAHADRRRIVDDEHRRALTRANGVIPATVLIDGRIGATWAVERTPLDPPRTRGGRTLATLRVEPFVPADRATRRELVAEGEAFVRFMADDAAEHRVVVA